MLSFSFLFLGQEELEYSWPFAPAETVVKEVVVGTAVRETAETGDRSARIQCVSQCLLSIPSNQVELKILIVSNYLLDCDGGVARGIGLP